MESRELIGVIRQELIQVEAQGGTQVGVPALRAYLDALEKHTEASQEHRRREHEGMLAQYEAKSQQSIEMLKAVLETGKSALHSLVIINGGAVIALLGVMSSLAGKPDGTLLARYLALPLLQFGIGVLCGALGFAFRYFSQSYYAASTRDKDKFEIWGDGFRFLAIFTAMAGFVLFGFAITNAYHAVVWSFSL